MGRSAKDSKPDGAIDNFIDWSLDSLSRKRKREECDSKKIDYNAEESYAMNLKPPSLVWTTSPHSISIASPSETSLPDIQELLHPRQASLSDTAVPALDEDADLQEIKPSIAAFKDDVFPAFPRSRSSCLSKQGNSDNKAPELQQLPAQDASPFMESSLDPIEHVKLDVIEIPDSLPPTKKPRNMLQPCQPEVKAKPRITLRLKKSDAKSSIKQSKSTVGRNVDKHIHLKRNQKKRRRTSAQESTGVEVLTPSRRTRTGREIKPTKKAAEAGRR